jgi:hypothetical protein
MEAAAAREIAQRLVAAFAWRIDRDGARDVANLFTEDARLVLPAGGPDWTRRIVLEGRAAIAARWSERPAGRVTRHLHLNLDITEASTTRIVCRSACLGYRHDGARWGAPNPMIVADYDDVCVPGADGIWRFLERRISVVFVSPELGS